MKKIKSVLVFSILFATIILAGGVARVSAEETPLTAEQIEQIRSNCVQTKNTLNRLHASDALLRVTMGQIYESISVKLMVGFNARVANNNLNASELVATASTFNSTLDIFRTDYIAYEEQLARAIAVDCTKQPVSFYDAVASARLRRSTVRQDVVSLNSYLDIYGTAVDKLKIQNFSDGVN